MCKKGDFFWDRSNQQVVECDGLNPVQSGTNVATGIPLTDDLLKELFNADCNSVVAVEIDGSPILNKEASGYSVNGKEIHYLHELQHEMKKMGLHKTIDKKKLEDYLKTL